MEEKRPKRRKEKYNPYTISKIEGRYYISFKDGQAIMHCIEISEGLFNLFNQFELDDISYLNEIDRHYEHFKLTETSLNERAFDNLQLLEDIAIFNLQKDILHKAIINLPKVQRKRLILYYFDKLTYKEIADMEGCTYQAVQSSIESAVKNLRKYLIDRF